VAEKIGALAVAGAIDGVAGVTKRRRQLPGQPRFVFGHEHTHAVKIPRKRLNDS